MNRFHLVDRFLSKYKHARPPFGFNGLGELVYARTYSRLKDELINERWWETTARVVEGTYNIQKRWVESNGLEWDSYKAQKSAQEMYDRMFYMKFLPPGRGIWAMGSPIIEEKELFAALNNCSFVSTENLQTDGSKPFVFLMDMSMLGVGVGFDTRGADKVVVKGQNKDRKKITYQIPDTREGWVESVRMLIDSYLNREAPIEFTYSAIRKKGMPIKIFGGVSSGPKPLEDLHIALSALFESRIGEMLSSRDIVDINNLIGKCVVSGNIRRTAEVAFGDPDDDEYINLKDYNKNPDRKGHGWTSNNSVFARIGMDYNETANRVRDNGEPGYIWMDNVKMYSRMSQPADHKDFRASGSNPCFSGDTLIAVADGRKAVSIKQLADEGNDVPVYSYNPVDGNVTIKMGRRPRITRRNAKVIRIVLDDDSSLIVTRDHKFILNTGEHKCASDLQKGDSIPRYTRRTQEIKKNGKKYYKIRTNTMDSSCEEYEHRIIAKFHHRNKWNRLYDDAKANGWIRGGIVVHHKNYNQLDNTPDNLDVLMFRDHQKLHGKNNSGEKNPMYGRSHSDKTKNLIGKRTKERCRSKQYIKKLSISHTEAERLEASKRMSNQQEKRLKEYYLEIEKHTDLNTLWIGNKLMVQKWCETCGTEVILPWRARSQCFCSRACLNKSEDHKKKRIEGQKKHLANKQLIVLSNQIHVYTSLENTLGVQPTKKEWEKACSDMHVPHRINRRSNNSYVLGSYNDLKELAVEYNHTVKYVEELDHKQDVYNITVDRNHTVGVITSANDNKMSGIFTPQCLEQALESWELCCLCEVFPNNHETIEDFERTLKFAYLYAKTVTLGKTHWPETNRVLLRNRRIGCSMSGIQQFITKHSLNTFKKWCEQGYDTIQRYDREYSDWLAIPRSIKTTSIKPSGTVSLLAGATPGMHWPESRFYIRRVRFPDIDIIKKVKEAGYKVERDVVDNTAMVVEVPVDAGENVRTLKDVTMWEQLMMVAFLQEHWADNQVSVTVSFDPETEGPHIARALEYFQYKLKSVSFLPKKKHKEYPQMPYESIDEDTYKKMVRRIKPLNLGRFRNEQTDVEKFCDGGKCEIQ